MTESETHCSPLQDQPSQPLHDIINCPPDSPLPSTQNSPAKPNSLQEELQSNIGPKQEAPSEQASDQLDEKTLRKECRAAQPEFISAKTISGNQAFSEIYELGNPEWDILSDLSSGEIAHAFKLEAGFGDITGPFLDLARKQKLTMCQHTVSFVTVKKGSNNSCKCLFRLWAGDEPDAEVYQLRKCSKGRDAKLILVEGNEPAFHNFYLSLLRVLQSKKLVKISAGARVQMLFDEERAETYDCGKVCSKMQKRLSRGKQVPSEEVGQLVQRLKNQATRLKKIVYEREEVADLNSLERQVESLSYEVSDIFSLFEKVHSKENQRFRVKRQQLLRKFPISKLFELLEIGEHYNQFRRLRSLKEIEEVDDKIPYMSAIKELRKLSSTVTPGAGYESILVFQQKIRTCYNSYFKNCLRVGDMDDYLPITIFCVLAADCEDNLLARVKLLLADLDGVYESEWEKKTLTDIEAAFDYILDQWHLAK